MDASPAFSPAAHPSSDEVEAYAQIIASHEGSTQVLPNWREEAELQLWAWREENRAPTRRTKSVRGKR